LEIADMAELPLQHVPIVDYGTEEAAMVRYRADGERRAMALGNRGPIRFGADGKLDPAILGAYLRCGFYVFEGVLGAEELADIERDVADMLDHAPTTKGAELDRHGRRALGVDCKGLNLSWVRPLSDPVGGTKHVQGRHPAKMFEPTPPEGAPEWVVQVILGSLQFSDACLRVYGHPQLLAVAEAVNGPDFTPFNEAVWVKQAGLGGSVAWHQDGWTHWQNPELDATSHGFNFMAQLYGCNAVNGLWIVPGSHRVGKADIKRLVEDAGSDRLPDAVPLLCAPGDVAICNRQAIHGSFANTSKDVRVTINFGFHRRDRVLNVTSGGVHNAVAVYDDARIRERSRMIMYAIDARGQRFPNETPYRYRPFDGEEALYRWTPVAKASIKDYNLLDLGI
jgi:hypothetical protein